MPSITCIPCVYQVVFVRELNSATVGLGILPSDACAGKPYYVYDHKKTSRDGACDGLPPLPGRYGLFLFTVDTIFSHSQIVIIAVFVVCSLCLKTLQLLLLHH